MTRAALLLTGNGTTQSFACIPGKVPPSTRAVQWAAALNRRCMRQPLIFREKRQLSDTLIFIWTRFLGGSRIGLRVVTNNACGNTHFKIVCTATTCLCCDNYLQQQLKNRLNTLRNYVMLHVCFSLSLYSLCPSSFTQPAFSRMVPPRQPGPVRGFFLLKRTF